MAGYIRGGFRTGDVVPGAVSYLNPAMALFGLDSRNSAINYLLVDNKGLPEGGLGRNTGNRATFRTRCVNQPGVLGGRADLPHRSRSRRLDFVYVDRRGDGTEGNRSAGLQHHTGAATCDAG